MYHWSKCILLWQCLLSCRSRERLITELKCRSKRGFTMLVVSRAGRWREWSQGELRLYFLFFVLGLGNTSKVETSTKRKLTVRFSMSHLPSSLHSSHETPYCFSLLAKGTMVYGVDGSRKAFFEIYFLFRTVARKWHLNERGKSVCSEKILSLRPKFFSFYFWISLYSGSLV